MWNFNEKQLVEAHICDNTKARETETRTAEVAVFFALHL
jgi:hypothetical protein